ncbi:hypothetical protein BpHYR1_001955 [Brachionus plicatilis]|uniref:Uncharacterized protein n=1 Tax=Brachionus plicatilis TaxID=10195 RepID=A0A3M7RUF5_BRAPC|nr:hypothetical protein BpHYR1_001955 [Brachionus plicatilis]
MAIVEVFFDCCQIWLSKLDIRLNYDLFAYEMLNSETKRKNKFHVKILVIKFGVEFRITKEFASSLCSISDKKIFKNKLMRNLICIKVCLILHILKYSKYFSIYFPKKFVIITIPNLISKLSEFMNVSL